MHNRIDHGEVISEKSHTKHPVPSAAAYSFRLHMKKRNPSPQPARDCQLLFMIDSDKKRQERVLRPQNDRQIKVLCVCVVS